jgi:hypothetical protein
MSGLFRAELMRMRSRRLVKWMTLLALAGIVLTGVIVFFNARDEPPRLDPAAERLYRQDFDACLRGEFGPLPEENPERFCEEITSVPIDDRRFHLSDLRNIFMGTTAPLMLLGWLLGASFVGAEWQKGTMTTTLSWEPRRVRVLAAKLAAAVLSCVALYVFLQAFLAAVLTPAALFRGTTSGLDGAWLREVAQVLLRGAGVTALGTVLGLSLAAIARNTAAALGLPFVYVVIVENLLRAWRPGWAEWFLSDNVALIVTADPVDFQFPRSVLGAAAVVTAYALVAYGAATLSFLRRDVT